MKRLHRLGSHEDQPLREIAGGMDLSELIEFADDFFGYDPTATVGKFVEVGDAGYAVAQTDAAGGVLSIASHGDADNDEIYVGSVAEVFKFTTNKKVSFRAKFQLTEANTDDANFIIGLSEIMAADTLVDNGAGPVAHFDGAVFYKVDGTMTLYFRSSNGATQSTAQSMCTFTSASKYEAGFDYDPNDGVTGKLTPWVRDLTAGVDYEGTAVDITISGLSEMHVLLGVKTGAAQVETLLVDYVEALQER